MGAAVGKTNCDGIKGGGSEESKGGTTTAAGAGGKAHSRGQN